MGRACCNLLGIVAYVDTLIRERSGGQRSLDDFARAFFGVGDGSLTPVTYDFGDVVRALNAIEPYDWGPFLRERLDSVGRPAPLDGLLRGGQITRGFNDMDKFGAERAGGQAGGGEILEQLGEAEGGEGR